jgi:alpha-beta hydrolase superfamily lysophospholipase
VTFAAADGLVVHGSLVGPSSGSSRGVVVLAHQLCSDRAEWSQASHDWVTALAQRGVTTVAIDLRGHGQSKLFPDGSTKDLCSGGADSLFAGMVSDVKAAVGYARTTLGAQSVAVIGASIGSNSALVAFSEDAQLAMVVALSPGLDYLGIKTDGAVSQLGSRPALLEAADDDSYSAGSVRQLQARNSALTTKIWPSGGHANQLLTSHPEELPRVADLVTAALGK